MNKNGCRKSDCVLEFGRSSGPYPGQGYRVDAWVRASLVGIEILAVEARVVVAGVDTFLKYAEAIGLTPLAAPPA